MICRLGGPTWRFVSAGALAVVGVIQAVWDVPDLARKPRPVARPLVPSLATQSRVIAVIVVIALLVAHLATARALLRRTRRSAPAAIALALLAGGNAARGGVFGWVCAALTIVVLLPLTAATVFGRRDPEPVAAQRLPTTSRPRPKRRR